MDWLSEALMMMTNFVVLSMCDCFDSALMMDYYFLILHRCRLIELCLFLLLVVYVMVQLIYQLQLGQRRQRQQHLNRGVYLWSYELDGGQTANLLYAFFWVLHFFDTKILEIISLNLN